MVGFNILDRAVSWFSPEAGERRIRSRLVIENVRAYDAAARGRRTDGWRTTGASADAEIGMAGAMLRNRSRDLVRNSPLAAKAVSELAVNLVGAGIRPRAASKNKRLNKAVDRLWDEWQAQCDADGHTDFHGLTMLAVREMIEGGDAIGRRWRQPSRAGLRVPLRISLMEIDHLDASKHDRLDGGGRIDAGIEYDAQGARRAFWLFPDHPGTTTPVFRSTLEAVRVPADGVAHMFERQRVQSRGVPWGAPVIRALRDLDDWHNAELVRKKTEACFVGAVIGDDDGALPGVATGKDGGGLMMTDRNGAPIEAFSPGMIGYLRGGRDIKFNQPSSAGGVEEWNRVQMHMIAAGYRIPYALLTGDLSKANFSSNRAGINGFRRMIDGMQWQIIIPMWCQPIWEWFCDAAYTAGLIPSPDVPVEWAPPSFQSVNPLQDAQADLLEVRAGFSTLAQKIAARGYDPQQVLEEQAAILAETDGLGLVFDSDPRRINKAGGVQMDPGGTASDDEGAAGAGGAGEGDDPPNQDS